MFQPKSFVQPGSTTIGVRRMKSMARRPQMPALPGFSPKIPAASANSLFRAQHVSVFRPPMSKSASTCKNSRPFPAQNMATRPGSGAPRTICNSIAHPPASLACPTRLKKINNSKDLCASKISRATKSGFWPNQPMHYSTPLASPNMCDYAHSRQMCSAKFGRVFATIFLRKCRSISGLSVGC